MTSAGSVIWLVVGIVAVYLVATKTTLVQTVKAQLQNLQAGGTGAGTTPAASTPPAADNTPAATPPAAGAPKAPKVKAQRNSNGKIVVAPAPADGGAAANAGCAAQCGGRYDKRVVQSGSETGVGCGGSGDNKGTPHWYTPGTNAQHARHHCYQGCPCCYLSPREGVMSNPGGCG